ncbi:MAG TPA: hypothetical protein PLL30_13780 [Candidatus Krumholzibacteria bacterium]|nr:hypothetical protein [Candidatus Krumholzibacteria bacterium]HRY42071.1 hypothetical protein [Candidatus Krumholzibacteria bacterium]
MATAVQAPAPLVLVAGTSFSTDLSATVLDAVSARPLHRVGMSAGARQALADPRPVAFQKVGGIGPVHGLAVLGRVHVIPRRHDLGAVVSEQEAEVEVWNADIQRGQTLEVITVAGTAGIAVEDNLGQPAHFPASASHTYLVKVLSDGDALIDNLVTWVFTELEPTGTNLRLLGFRLIPFPFPPNWAQPVTETFGFMTDIIVSYRGMEQRIQLRAVPVGTIRYATLLDDLRDAQMAGAILFGNQARAFGVGRWQFQTRLLQSASAGDHDILCDTSDIPFEPGGMVLLWIDPYHWEVQTIENVLPDRVVLDFGLIQPWTAGLTLVLPIVVGRLSDDEGFTWDALAIGSTSLTFDIDGFRP